jgi:hypothetical protein
VAVGPHQDLNSRPARAQRPDQPPQQRPRLFAARPLARSQQRGHEASLAVEHDNRLEPVIVMEGIEQSQLLAAVYPVKSIVDVEHDVLGRIPEGRAVLIDQGAGRAQQHPAVGQVLQSRDRRLRAQIGRRRQPLQRQLEHRIAAQRIGVVAVLVAGRDHQHAKADDLG